MRVIFFSILIACTPAFAIETVSPPYLWLETTALAKARLIICSEQKILPKALNEAMDLSFIGSGFSVYRNMSYRFYAINTAQSFVYDQPISVKTSEFSSTETLLTFYRKESPTNSPLERRRRLEQELEQALEPITVLAIRRVPDLVLAGQAVVGRPVAQPVVARAGRGLCGSFDDPCDSGDWASANILLFNFAVSPQIDTS